MILGYLGGFFLGTTLGANDSANVFGTAVGSKMIKYRSAAFLAALFVFLGALFQGAEGVETLSNMSSQSMKTATATVYAAAATVTLMTLLKLPTSTSQAVVGAIIGVGLMRGEARFDGLGKVIICWIGTPIGALIFYILFDKVFRKLLSLYNPSIFSLDLLLRSGLLICGCYGAYALGANNAANVAAVFVGEDMLTARTASILGGAGIAFGVLTFSKPVMMTVGKGIIKMDAFSAFTAVLSHAVTVHIFAMIGVPVSSSQAIVGAVLGISIVKGVQVIRFRVLRNVVIAWVATPICAGTIAAVIIRLTRLQ